jgi:molybdopterin-guanine dinucleotide biosynthesis protein A
MGCEKAMLPFGGSTMLEHVVLRLSQVTKPLVIVAASEQVLPPLPEDCRVIRDERPDCGPLEGVRVGLAALVGDCDAAYVTSCDAPLLIAGVVPFLASQLGDFECVTVVEEGRVRPLASIYRTSLTGVAAGLLEKGQFRLQGLLESVRTRRLDARELRSLDPELLTLRNINTPEDYQRALLEIE